mmetsp:Transcript_37095/g.76041  ORF Transcript_37095/g.76041 Transcript_37095/m.76041 type:complete len:80 (+) Transcript_37095:1373-1612(+)
MSTVLSDAPSPGGERGAFVLPATLRRTCIVWNAAYESRPERGSSRKRIRGFVTSSTPMAVRFFSPPEMPLCSASPMRVS